MERHNQSTLVGNVSKFLIKGKKLNVDITPGIVKISYYEDILVNTVSLSVDVVEVGDSNTGIKKGMLDAVPIRGGEEIEIEMTDANDIPLNFTGDNALYVDTVDNVLTGTTKNAYTISAVSREMFANNQSRVVKRYDGKISENVKKILTESISGDSGIKTKKTIDVDETKEPFNFTGNYRKPFHVCTWLASKSVPVGVGGPGGAAGYLFFETYDGFKFKSIDKLFTQPHYPKKYIFTDTPIRPTAYEGKILDYTIARDIDLSNNLMLGAYANTTLFFDFYANDYQLRTFGVDSSDDAEKTGGGSKGKTEHGGADDIFTVNDEFRKSPSRLMNTVLDIGTLPSGKDSTEQLKNWKENREKPTSDPYNTMVQAAMRYNQLFGIKINIMIAGEFNLRAGDLLFCEFPELTIEKSTMSYNEVSGGIYMISSLCHRITGKDTYTSLSLVRDTFGRKSY